MKEFPKLLIPNGMNFVLSEQQRLAQIHEAALVKQQEFIKKHFTVMNKSLNVPRKRRSKLKLLLLSKIVNLKLD